MFDQVTYFVIPIIIFQVVLLSKATSERTQNFVFYWAALLLFELLQFYLSWQYSPALFKLHT